jgi:hypothetical protein
MRGIFSVVSIAFLAAAIIAPAQAGWQAKRKGSVCFATLTPSESRNAPPDRGKAFVAITANKAENSFDALTFTSGYPDVTKSVPTVSIGAKTFDLLPYGGAAFVRAGQPEQDVVSAMLSNQKMQVIWRSADGKTVIVDDYSLEGMAIARSVIDKACDREAVQAQAAQTQQGQPNAIQASADALATAPRGNPFK